MAEHPRGRQAVERLAQRLVEQSEKGAAAGKGRPLTHKQAREIARESAIRTDRRQGR